MVLYLTSIIMGVSLKKLSFLFLLACHSILFAQGRIFYNELSLSRLKDQINSVNDYRARMSLSSVTASMDSITKNVTTDPALEIRLDPVLYAYTASLDVLPVHVDNSQLKAFPPISDQGPLGSCQAFSFAYYVASHELTLRTGWDNTTAVDSQLVSPLWVYNQNAGIVPPSVMDIGDVLKVHGTVFLDDMPYNTQNLEYLRWPTDSSVWKSALDYRITDYYRDYAYKYTRGNLSPIKAWLANGHVVSVSTNIMGYQYDVIKNDITTTADDSLVGKDIVYRVKETLSLGHLMTIVGYDDEVWTDVNANNTLDPGEKGAFKLANSWGEDWGDKGFVWIAYDAIVNPSRVTVVNTRSDEGTKTPGIQDFTWLQYPKQVSPKKRLRARITLEHGGRGNMSLSIGKGKYQSTVMEDSLALPYFYFNGGPYSLDGSDTAMKMTFFIDLEQLESQGNQHRFWLILNNRSINPNAASKGIIHDFAVIDSSSQGIYTWNSSNTPFEVNIDSEGRVYVDYNFIPIEGRIISSSPMSYSGGNRSLLLAGQNHWTFHAQTSERVVIKLYGLQGELLWSQEQMLQEGTNTLTFEAQSRPTLILLQRIEK